jgi:hypothetical protein
VSRSLRNNIWGCQGLGLGLGLDSVESSNEIDQERCLGRTRNVVAFGFAGSVRVHVTRLDVETLSGNPEIAYP